MKKLYSIDLEKGEQRKKTTRDILRELKEKEFYASFYAIFIYERINAYRDVRASKEKDQLKQMLLMIKKRKIENGKLLALLEQATLNSNKKKYYKTLVQNNTRVVLHLQVRS